MSENNNPPNDDIQQKALKFLEKKWPKKKRICEICGENHWSIQQHSVTPTILKDASFQFGGSSYPQVMVICMNCSNTKYFNTVIMDAIEKKENEAKDGQ